MSSPSPHTSDLLDVDAMTADSQRDLTFIHDTFGTIFEDMGLDTLAAEVFNPTSVPSASITLEHPKTPHKEREMSSPRANGTDARFLHPDIDEFMAPSPAKVITSTPAKRPTTLKPTTPADHLLSLISSPAPVMHDYSSPTSRSTHTARSNFLSSTGNKLIHAASPSQQILADVTRKHARSPSADLHSRTKRRRTDGTIPFAVIKPPSNTVEHYRPPPTTVGMVLTGTPASTTSARTTLFQSTGLQNKTPATTTIKSEVVESDDDDDDDDAPRKKKNSARGLQQKGLRHFSLKVCEKVERQQVTTYNKVADELVTELTDPTKSTGLGTGKKSYDEKNIRRRVYDALNVLMAMGIIEKEKKKITWIGLPGGGMGTEDVMALQQEKAARLDRLSKKRQLLAQLLTQQVCVRRILQRNATHPPSIRTHDSSMRFPFVVIECPIDVTVNTAMTPARDAMEMTFSDTFRVHEHSDILEKMNLPYVTAQDLPHLIPREMCPFYPPEWMTTEKKSNLGGKATVVKQEIR